MRRVFLLPVLLLVLVAGTTLWAQSNQLIRDLAEKPTATVEDGLRMALLLTQGVGATEPLEEVVAKVRGSDLVREKWLEKPAENLRKGQLAYIIVKACGIKGGLTMRLTGVSERYALRECIFLSLLERGSTGNSVSGLELLGSMGRAEKYLEEHPQESR